MDIIGLVLGSSFLVKAIVLILLLMSLYSWVLIFKKLPIAKREKRLMTSVANRVRDDYKLETFAKCEKEEGFGGQLFYKSVLFICTSDDQLPEKIELLRSTNVSNFEGYLSDKLNHLAIIASTAPYIGLLGTVIGILDAFHKIGGAKVVTLTMIAPSISEALLVTAFGLMVAIPANVYFNLIKGHAAEALEQLEKALAALKAFRTRDGS